MHLNSNCNIYKYSTVKTIRVYGKFNYWIDVEIENDQNDDMAIIIAMTTNLDRWNCEEYKDEFGC